MSMLERTSTTAVLSSVPAGLLHPPDSSALACPTDVVPPLTRKVGTTRKFSRKPPKDSRVRKAVLVYLALRAQGFKIDEIADHLQLTKLTIQTYVKRANQAGWINLESFSDPADQLEHVLQSKAVRNINTVLDEVVTDEASGISAPSNRASDVALEVAKGTGLLKQHQIVKSEGTTNLGVALKVHVEMPPSGSTPVVLAGTLGGQPAFDADILE